MHLEIITPDIKAFEGEVTAVKVPGTDGTFEMLNKHANIISTLVNGEVRIQTADKQTKTFEIEGGVVEMLDNKVVILAEAIKSGKAS